MGVATADELLRLGREALAAADWEGARALFEQAAEFGETAEVLDGLGEALQFGGEHARAIELKERAFVEYERRGLRAEAAELARWLAFLYASAYGNVAAANGWMARAESVLEGVEECAAHGWLILDRAPWTSDASEREQFAAEAIEIARRYGDRDLEFDAMALLGEAYVASGRVAEGMTVLDQAMAAVAAGEVARRRRRRRDLLQVLERLRADDRRQTRRAVARDRNSLRGMGRLRAADLPDALRRHPDRARPLGGGGARAAGSGPRVRDGLPRGAAFPVASACGASRSPGTVRGGRTSAGGHRLAHESESGRWRRSRWHAATSRSRRISSALPREHPAVRSGVARRCSACSSRYSSLAATWSPQTRHSNSSPSSPASSEDDRTRAVADSSPRAESEPLEETSKHGRTSRRPWSCSRGSVLTLEAAQARVALARALASHAPAAAVVEARHALDDVRASGRGPRCRRGRRPTPRARRSGRGPSRRGTGR